MTRSQQLLERAYGAAIDLQRQLLDPLRETFVGKHEVVDVLGVSLVAGEHAFLLGPPGTAKSAIVNEMTRRLGGNVFSYLLTRFTEPSELFGPFDIRRLREGELVTNTEGMLPEASVVFLDELLNANSAILNSLLTVLNERIFRRGRETRRLPLWMVVGASNHLPEDDALGALFDRFLLRVVCDNAPDDRLQDVLDAGWQFERADRDAAQAGNSVDADCLPRLHAALLEVDLTPMRSTFVKLVEAIRRIGLSLSDRRAVKLQRVIAASALLAQRSEANSTDLWVLRHIWESDEQRQTLRSLVDDAIAKGCERADSRPHPAAVRAQAPDSEELARDLEAIAALADDEPGTRAADRLRALASRVEWVPDEPQRSELQQRIAELWRQLRAE
ncbi:MAG: AAA family ATPase [Planctomycetota bacterium]